MQVIGNRIMRLFQIDSDGLVEICERGLDREGLLQQELKNELQKAIRNKTGCVFPGLVALQDKDNVGSGQPSTVAFDTKQNVFVIIDYKSKTAADAQKHVQKYFTEMRNHKDKYVDLYNDVMGEHRTSDDFGWDKIHAVTLSPKRRNCCLEDTGPDGNVRQYVVNLYHGGVLVMEQLEAVCT